MSLPALPYVYSMRFDASTPALLARDRLTTVAAKNLIYDQT